jgi:hypothetical protein
LRDPWVDYFLSIKGSVRVAIIYGLLDWVIFFTECGLKKQNNNNLLRLAYKHDKMEIVQYYINLGATI